MTKLLISLVIFAGFSFGQCKPWYDPLLGMMTCPPGSSSGSGVTPKACTENPISATGATNTCTHNLGNAVNQIWCFDSSSNAPVSVSQTTAGANSSVFGVATPETLNCYATTGGIGAAGTNGTNGTNGAAATIAVGTVTTGAAGSSVIVTNAGSSSAATFNFTIPRGDTGASGAGSGTVTSSGTPLIHQLPVWTTATDAKGIAVGADNQVLRGHTGADPAFGVLVTADLPVSANANLHSGATTYAAPETCTTVVSSYTDYSGQAATSYQVRLFTCPAYWSPRSFRIEETSTLTVSGTTGGAAVTALAACIGTTGTPCGYKSSFPLMAASSPAFAETGGGISLATTAAGTQDVYLQLVNTSVNPAGYLSNLTGGSITTRICGVTLQ
jgi:hypothetical protein